MRRVSALLLLLLLPCVRAEATQERIYGGAASQPCQWPSTVGLLFTNGVLCSGTLVAPQVVVYAAHCGTDVAEIDFGEHVSGLNPPPARVLVPQYCRVYPNHDPTNGTDFAYCKLAQPVTDVPIVPVLMGCETSALVAGKQVVLVGFGTDEQGHSGVKRQVTTVQDYLSANKAFIGGSGQDTCFGDSGGPAFVQLTQTDGLPGQTTGSWRVYGITSYTPSGQCGPGGYDSLIYLAAPWIEADSGVDITPCTRADGTWDPGPNCGAFPLAPDASGDTWGNGCQTPMLSGLESTCGTAFNPQLPFVTITTPSSTVPVLDSGSLSITVHTAGAVTNVGVTYDGQVLPMQSQAPPAAVYGPTKLAIGTHTIVATASDDSGHTSTDTMTLSVQSAPVTPVAAPVTPSGGCQATPTSGVWPVAVAVAAYLSRRRLRRRNHASNSLAKRVPWGIAALIAITGCGGSSPKLTPAPQNTTVAVSSNINTDNSGAVDNEPAQGPTSGINSVSGNDAGYSLTARAALYFYVADPNGLPMLALVLSDQPDYCTVLADNSDRANGTSLLFLVANGSNATDIPLSGTFQIVASNTAAAGPYATAAFSKNDGKCQNILTAAQTNATAGRLTLKTEITTAGAFVSGNFAGITFDNSVDAFSAGTFFATDCTQVGNSNAPPGCN